MYNQCSSPRSLAEFSQHCAFSFVLVSRAGGDDDDKAVMWDTTKNTPQDLEILVHARYDDG